MTNFYTSLINDQTSLSIQEAEFEAISSNMLKYLVNKSDIIKLSKINDIDLTDLTLGIGILVCNDEKMHELNKTYRDKDCTTDVLSFALFVDSPESRVILDNEIFLGEIVISAEKAKAQADENGKTFEQEMLFLLSHGILHLFGFDHKNEEELEFMLKVQDELVNVECG